MDTHEILSSIHALVEAVAERCGLMASCKRLCHESGAKTTSVQICTVPLGVKPSADDWVFIQAYDDADLPRVRDELAAFVAEHRRNAA